MQILYCCACLPRLDWHEKTNDSVQSFNRKFTSRVQNNSQTTLLVSVGTMVNFVALAREHWVNILVPMGFVIGWYLDKQQDQKLTAFRNKSALFSR